MTENIYVYAGAAVALAAVWRFIASRRKQDVSMAPFTTENSAGASVRAKRPAADSSAVSVNAPAPDASTEIRGSGALFDVILVDAGSQFISVIKAVREATGLGLKEAKDLVEAAPQPVRSGVSQGEASALRSKFGAIGARVEIR